MGNYKVKEFNWPLMMYLINNFFTPLVFTNGRDLYPDRVTFARNREAQFIFDCKGSKNIEYYTLNAISEETSKVKILKVREIAERVITDSLFINDVFNLNKQNQDVHNYTKLFDYVHNTLASTQTTDYNKLNAFILEAYKKLDLDDALKVASFRENAINVCLKYNLISEDYANEQKDLFPNSTLKLQSRYNM